MTQFKDAKMEVLNFSGDNKSLNVTTVERDRDGNIKRGGLLTLTYVQQEIISDKILNLINNELVTLKIK